VPDERTTGAEAAQARVLLAAALRRVAIGDRAAFGEVYRRSSAKLFGVCLRILPGRAEAEEALQEAYLSVWQRAASFDETRGSAMTWLIALARNRAIDRLRAGGKIQVSPIDLAAGVADDAADAFSVLAADGEERRLAVCMAALEAGDARFIRSAFAEGSTYAELATRAGMPLGTVKSRIRRALLKLRDCLQ
jgi:RNA polymerase sigma-70 factor (ECF subfamily)